MAVSQFFRANVGIVVTDGRGHVLTFERLRPAGQWNLPQGGLDEGEEPLAGALRELYEETGLGADQIEVVGEHPRWLAYELPVELRRSKTGRGQCQKWICVRASAPDALRIDYLVDGSPEFTSSEWVTPEVASERTIEFRRPIYAEVFAEFAAAIGAAAP